MLECTQQVRYGGLRFNVRTAHEVEGTQQRIVSLLLFEQEVVDRRQRSYRAIVGPARGVQLLRLMGRQHRKMVADLTQGILDERIAATPGTGEFRALEADVDGADDGSANDAGPNLPTEGSPPAIDLLVRDLLASSHSDDASAVASVADPPIRSQPEIEPGLSEWTAAASEFAESEVTAVGLGADGASIQFGRQASFCGDLSLLGVPDLLEFLHLGQRTGTLVLIGHDGMGQIQLRAGRITHGASPGCPRIPLLLQRGGIVDEQQLERAREAMAAAPDDIALIRELRRAGAVTGDQLREAATERIYAVLIELLQWSHGQFVFDSCAAEALPRVAVELELDIQAMLLDTLRRLDERRRGSRPS